MKATKPTYDGERDPRFVSVATRLACLIFALLAGVSFLVAFELTQREREHFIESKQRAARMLTELFALSIAPALDFADADAVTSSLEMLGQNPEVVDAAVWSAGRDLPLVRLGRDGSLLRSEDRAPGTRIAANHIDIAVESRSPIGKPLGTAWVRVSLIQENAAFVAARRRIFWSSFAFSALVAGLLVAIVRRTIISPLAKLERAAGDLGAGKLIELDDLGRDEIGSLGRTFNQMGRAIRDREACIGAVNARLQGLLDNMRQAIVLFDGQGRLAPERSRTAREVFGAAAGETTDVVDLLYPPDQATGVEREAFRVWLAEAERASVDGFEELAELAPNEVNLHRQGAAEQILELEFRRAANEHGDLRVMLLATDVTAQRHLERSVQAREREHEKQLAAMRRLVAGGGQVFLRFVAVTRQRLRECEQGLAHTELLTPMLAEDVFRLVHTLRAEARSFDLRTVEQLALGLESELAGARHVPADSPLWHTIDEKLQKGCRDLARELDRAEEIFVASSPIGRRVLEQVTVSRRDLEELYQLFGKRRDELGRLATRLSSRPFGEIVSSFPDDVQRWARKEGKSVELVVNGREALVPPPLCERLSGALAHLVRNAVAHGIETPTFRQEHAKTETGRIELVCVELAQGVTISVIDDGAGFDFEALSRRAGRAALSPADVELAFEPGVSTRDTADELAGCGVGLGAAREELRRVGYVINIISKRGGGVTARIEPLPPKQAVLWSSNPSS